MSKQKRKSEIRKNRARHEKKGFLGTFILWSFLLGLVLVICAAGAGLVLYYSISKDLPKITSLADYHPSIITTVYADDNRKIAEFFKERIRSETFESRSWQSRVDLAKISAILVIIAGNLIRNLTV